VKVFIAEIRCQKAGLSYKYLYLVGESHTKPKYSAVVVKTQEAKRVDPTKYHRVVPQAVRSAHSASVAHVKFNQS
jgi:hypothetical protein